MSFIGMIIRKVLQREARKYPLADWPGVLAATQPKVTGRFEAGADSAENQETGRHIIGIERWSQSRLRVFLGGELVMDEYNAYEPASDLNMAALAQAFEEARQTSVELANQIVAAGIGDEKTVPHNDMGDLNASTWLAYISGHALRESGRIKA